MSADVEKFDELVADVTECFKIADGMEVYFKAALTNDNQAAL